MCVFCEISSVILSCHASGRKIGLCGQAPSDKPEYAAWLMQQQIDSISLNPSDVIKTMAMGQQGQRKQAQRQGSNAVSCEAKADANKQRDDNKDEARLELADTTHQRGL